MGTVAFGVLGPLQVERDGRPVQLNAPKLRVLLAALLLRANTPVPVVTLVHWLWGEDPSPTAHKTTQMYVFRLRRVLGGDVVIETGPNSYLLRLQPGQLDLLRFRRLADRARAGPAGDECRLLGEALAWSGARWRAVGAVAARRGRVAGRGTAAGPGTLLRGEPGAGQPVAHPQVGAI